jgi:hypothetical protein
MMPSARNAPAGPRDAAAKSGRLTSSEGHARVEVALRLEQLVGDAVQVVEARAHRLLEPDRQRIEILVDAVERDRPALGDRAQQRLELAERGSWRSTPGSARGYSDQARA